MVEEKQLDEPGYDRRPKRLLQNLAFPVQRDKNGNENHMLHIDFLPDPVPLKNNVSKT